MDELASRTTDEDWLRILSEAADKAPDARSDCERSLCIGFPDSSVLTAYEAPLVGESIVRPAFTVKH
jgi:hypothetical protein